MHYPLNRNQSDKKRTFSRLDKAIKLSQMTDFPTLSYPSISELLPFHTPEVLKRFSFRAEPPPVISHLREYPPPGGVGKTDLMSLPMSLPFFCSFYRMPLTCYPSYINYQMPLCCSLSLLSWHRYKIVRWGEVFIIATQSPYARKNLGTSAGHLSQLFPLDHQRPWLRFRWIIFCRCSNIRTDREGEGLSLTHIPTIMKAVLNITRTFEVNRTS